MGHDVIVTYSGWVRLRHGRWREVARHEGWGACWDATLAYPVVDDFCERTVLESHRTPGAGAVRMKETA